MISLHPRRALVALLLLATAAFPHTGILDPVEQALDAVIAAHPGDETVAKAANKLLEAIALLGEGTPLATEMKVAAKVAKGVEKAVTVEREPADGEPGVIHFEVT